MSKLYRCHNCRTDFYTDDGLARHMCPGRDFETNLIGTQKRLEALEKENKKLRGWLECMRIIASFGLGEPNGDGRRESDGESQQGTD